MVGGLATASLGSVDRRGEGKERNYEMCDPGANVLYSIRHLHMNILITINIRNVRVVDIQAVRAVLSAWLARRAAVDAVLLRGG